MYGGNILAECCQQCGAMLSNMSRIPASVVPYWKISCCLPRCRVAVCSKLSVASPTSQLILQPFPRFTYSTSQLILQHFRCFTYVTDHSPTSQALHLIEHSSFSNPSLALPTVRHNSFSNPSVASPTSQLILQLFFRLSYVTRFSLTSPGEPPMLVSRARRKAT